MTYLGWGRLEDLAAVGMDHTEVYGIHHSPCEMMHLGLINIIHRYCPKLIIGTQYKPCVSVQTAQLSALIQRMRMVKRAKGRLLCAELGTRQWGCGSAQISAAPQHVEWGRWAHGRESHQQVLARPCPPGVLSCSGGCHAQCDTSHSKPKGCGGKSSG